MEERTIYAGMDLRENKIQLCAYPPQSSEIKMILEDFPLLIAIEEDKKEWIFGERALEKKEQKEGIVITGFLELLETTEEITIYGVRFSVEDLLSKIIKKALLFLKTEFPNDLIRHLNVSLENPSKKLEERLKRAFLKLGIDGDRLQVESHGHSFLCYALSQKKELWIGEVGLLDGSGGEILFRRILLDRKRRPVIAGVTREKLAKPMEKEEIVQVVKPEIGTLYLTGSGFSGEERLNLVHQLCRGRRGFLGESLYCEGACISAKSQENPEMMEGFLLLEEDSIQCEISIPIYHDGKECRAYLAKASEKWQDVKKNACLILEDEEEIPVTVSYLPSGEEKTYIIALEGMWKRPSRMTKVSLRLMFTDKKTCIVRVKDLGFGEFCPSSQRIWEKTIEL
ncbi:MAG: DUF5716 family protein [Acetivibrio ethanolgignens]